MGLFQLCGQRVRISRPEERGTRQSDEESPKSGVTALDWQVHQKI